MKYLSAFMLLCLLSCKNDIKPEDSIDASVYEMWNDYTQANSQFKNEKLPESWFFHNNEKDANRLGKLVLDGKKQAASGLYLWYKEANADLPKTGIKHIITDFSGKALAIIEIKNVDTIPFKKISKTYAEMDMGTTIKPLEKWKKAHWDFFATSLEESGQNPNEDMLVVCEWFETIWPKNKN